MVEQTPDVWVNWQGDEPFFTYKIINDLLQSVHRTEQELWTLKKKITSESEVTAKHFAKVVCDNNNNALFFSRSPIPCYRDETDFTKMHYYKHVGIYAYRHTTLQKISTLLPSYLEKAEELEQLRFLAAGIKVTVHETQQDSIGIDLPEHIEKAEDFLVRNSATL
jgi:3-deoxy-manno-octulosonate cytidylyltransferase (CMP-KDO synthetase)